MKNSVFLSFTMFLFVNLQGQCRVDSTVISSKKAGKPVEIEERDHYYYDSNDSLIGSTATTYYAGAVDGRDSITFLRDSKGRESERTYYFFDDVNGVWKTTYRYKFIYHPTNGKIKTESFQYFENSNWRDESVVNSTYDGSGNLIRREYSYWRSHINSMRNGYAIDFSMYSNKTYQLQTEYNWDTVANLWTNNIKIEFDLNSSDQIVAKRLYGWDDTKQIWNKSLLDSFHYNSKGKELKRISRTWDKGTSKYEDYYLYTHTYDTSGKMLTYLVERWDYITNKYIPGTYSTYTYYRNGKDSFWELFTWNGTSFDHSMLFVFYDYQGDRPMKSLEYTYWNSSKNAYDNIRTTQDYCGGGITRLSSLKLDAGRIYPLPAFDYLVIEDFNKAGDQEPEVYTADGHQLILPFQTTDNKMRFDVSGLSSGLYFVRIQQGGNAKMYKFAVAR